MSNEQLYFAIGIPLVFNATISLALWLNVRSNVNLGFDAVNRRFDDMREVWRAELRRVEDVLDARLKHLEEH